MGCNLCFSIISIHAPTRGATYQQVHFTVAYIIFQSTLPREERRRFKCGNDHLKLFQSSLPREERLSVFPIAVSFAVFQSTLPREERPLRLLPFLRFRHYFNPRSHERSDVRSTLISPFAFCISIHAPTRGATAILHKKFVYFYTIPTINI